MMLSILDEALCETLRSLTDSGEPNIQRITYQCVINKKESQNASIQQTNH